MIFASFFLFSLFAPLRTHIAIARPRILFLLSPRARFSAPFFRRAFVVIVDVTEVRAAADSGGRKGRVLRSARSTIARGSGRRGHAQLSEQDGLPFGGQAAAQGRGLGPKTDGPHRDVVGGSLYAKRATVEPVPAAAATYYAPLPTSLFPF